MDNEKARRHIDLAIRAAIAEAQAGKETKEKINAIVNMATASVQSIAETVHISPEVLTTIVGNKLMSKGTEIYIERSGGNVEAETL